MPTLILAAKLSLPAAVIAAAYRILAQQVADTPFAELVVGGGFLGGLVLCFSLLLRHVLAQDRRMDFRTESILDRAIADRDRYYEQLTACREEGRHMRDLLLTHGINPDDG